MESIIHNITGLIHTLAAVVALITGTAVLSFRKGTSFHIKIGYIYVVSMLVVNITAFMIYRLFGGFGVFHIAALLSLCTIIGGMVPVLRRKPEGSWLSLHLSFMYWSVMGLYAAFASEMLTRVPDSPFFSMVGLATGLIMSIAGFYFYYKKNRWAALFATESAD